MQIQYILCEMTPKTRPVQGNIFLHKGLRRPPWISISKKMCTFTGLVFGPLQKSHEGKFGDPWGEIWGPNHEGKFGDSWGEIWGPMGGNLGTHEGKFGDSWGEIRGPMRGNLGTFFGQKIWNIHQKLPMRGNLGTHEGKMGDSWEGNVGTHGGKFGDSWGEIWGLVRGNLGTKRGQKPKS